MRSQKPTTQRAASHLTDMSDRVSMVEAVNAQIALVLARQVEAANKLGPSYGELLETVRTFVARGGKRLRPLLTVWSYAGFGGESKQSIIQVAAGQELFHAGILMHDDIIDRDLTRWAGPNISGHYVSKFKTLSDSGARHLADSYALMAGDLCIDMSYQQLLASDFDSTNVLAGLRLMHDTLFTVLGGEVIDVSAPLVPLNYVKSDDLLAMYEYKTAAYTFCLPLKLGAILANAPENVRPLIHDFGVNLGIAYQLQDDILSMFGDPEQTGKPNLGDLREGKRTRLTHFAYHHASAAEKNFLETWLGNPAATSQELIRVQTILQNTGALAYAEKLALSYHRKAITLLPQLGWRPPYVQILTDMCNGLLGRKM